MYGGESILGAGSSNIPKMTGTDAHYVDKHRFDLLELIILEIEQEVRAPCLPRSNYPFGLSFSRYHSGPIT